MGFSRNRAKLLGLVALGIVRDRIVGAAVMVIPGIHDWTRVHKSENAGFALRRAYFDRMSAMSIVSA